MNNYYTMPASVESKYRQKAALITVVFAGLMLLLMFLLKWSIADFERVVQQPVIEVELNLEDEAVSQTLDDGGGGGGNPVQASGPKGVAPEVSPTPGEPDDSKELDDDPHSESPAITKPPKVKNEATKITNKSVEKAEPKPVEVPAPPRPKAVLGKTTTGTGRGGEADDYEKPGGSGNAFGVGSGNGTGGGSGNGTGGGNGTGIGAGSGPRVTKGDRKIVRYYTFEGDLDRAVIYANVLVSPEGIGKFVSIAKGSTSSSNAYKQAIIHYLQNIRFDKADHESMVTVQFNFTVN